MAWRVMIADDDEAMLELYAQVLRSDPEFELVAAVTDGRSAVEAFAHLDPAPDVVILDNRMPGMSGIEAAQAILARDPQLPILMVSGDRSVRDAALQAGVRRFLTKTFSLRRLRDELRALTEGARQRRAQRVPACAWAPLVVALVALVCGFLVAPFLPLEARWQSALAGALLLLGSLLPWVPGKRCGRLPHPGEILLR